MQRGYWQSKLMQYHFINLQKYTQARSHTHASTRTYLAQDFGLPVRRETTETRE